MLCSELGCVTSQGEMYVGRGGGHGCYFPVLPWLHSGRAHFPAAELTETAKNMRQLMRLLWALHLAFQEVRPRP